MTKELADREARILRQKEEGNAERSSQEEKRARDLLLELNCALSLLIEPAMGFANTVSSCLLL